MFADFYDTNWRIGWSESIDLRDPAVKAWLSTTAYTDTQSRWLFLPKYTPLELLTTVNDCAVSAQFKNKPQTPVEGYFSSKEFRSELHKRNKAIFKAVERHIRNRILNGHRCCIYALQQLLKAKGTEFPPICPYAYAYVFWRKAVLESSKFYSLMRGDDIHEPDLFGVEFATQLINDKLSFLTKRFLMHTTAQRHYRSELLHWILDKTTVQFCFNFFHFWLQEAAEGAKFTKVPNWPQIHRMKESCFPKMAFKYIVRMEDDVSEVAFFIRPDENKIPMYDCPFSTKRARKSLRGMETCTPQSAAMKVFENPNDLNKELKKYVERYVGMLTF